MSAGKRRWRLSLAEFVACAILLLGAFCVGAFGREKSADDRARALADEGASLLAKGELADAETALGEAVELAPGNPFYLYKLACARARQGKGDQAIKDLEQAALSGFTDFWRIARDADLDGLRDRPRFRQLLANKDVFFRRTAKGTLAALRERFGEEGYRYEIDHERRLVFAVALDAAALRQLRAELAEQADSLAAELFEQRPEAYVTVLMPTPADFGEFIRFRNVPGIYVDSTKTLLAQERGYVMRHEFAHALHAADRAPLGQEHAPWFAEGLGVMCEAAEFAGGKVKARDNPRFAAMPHAARRKALVPLERLLAMKHKEFIQRPNLTYAQSGYLVLYLHEKQLLRAFYDEYKTSFDRDPTGRAALEHVTEMRLPELQESWRVWLAARAEKTKR